MNAFTFFRGLIPLPKNMIEPASSYEIFTDRSGCEDSGLISLLTHLFFAIGSPDAFDQLCDACSASQQIRKPIVPESTNSRVSLKPCERLIS